MASSRSLVGSLPALPGTPPPSNFLLRFSLSILYTVFVLCGISFIYSFSAFKADLRSHFGYDELTAAYIFTFANLGQNFVVHMGAMYDRYGAVTTSVVSGILKLIGNLGMFVLTIHHWDSPTLFGIFFAMDAQATGAAIIMAQMEAQKKTPPEFKGVANRNNVHFAIVDARQVGSICAASFGLGATLWVSGYDMFLKPDIEKHFLAGSTSSGEAPASSSIGSLIFSIDFIALFSATLVTWSVAMVFIAHLGSMADAAALSPQEGARIRSVYFTCSTVGRLLAGPLSDLTRRYLPLEFWVWMTTVVTGVAVGGLILFGFADTLFAASVAVGLAFGGISTFVPLMCRALQANVAGTLYAVAKVGSLVLSTLWIGYAGREIEAVKAMTGATGGLCVGDECYHYTLYLIEGMSLPLTAMTGVWAFRSLARLHMHGGRGALKGKQKVA
eukprot:g8593.t1